MKNCQKCGKENIIGVFNQFPCLCADCEEILDQLKSKWLKGEISVGLSIKEKKPLNKLTEVILIYNNGCRTLHLNTNTFDSLKIEYLREYSQILLKESNRIEKKPKDTPERIFESQKYERCKFFSDGLCSMKRGSAGNCIDDSCDLQNDCEYWDGDE